MQMKDNWPAPNEYLLELGRITALWGSLEHSVNAAISKFAGYEAVYDFRAAIMTAHANFKQRLDILGSLCDQLKNEYPHLKAYEKTISLIVKAQNRRNKYMHNGIFYNEQTKQVEIASLSARGKLKTNVERVTVEDLQATSAAIHEALCALYGLVTQHMVKPMWERSDSQ